tara:strand:+ start:960 stop:1415 length:456 start_codon:yes stop_codon:yes gene_type:complete
MLMNYKRRTSFSVEASIKQPKNQEKSSKNCPKCKELMTNVKHGDIGMDKCEFCHGYWIKDGQLEYLCENLSEYQLDLLHSIGQSKEKKKNYNNLFHFNSRMRCPDCPKDLREIYFKLDHNIKLDICDRCHGVFYDSNELNQIIKLIRNSNI